MRQVGRTQVEVPRFGLGTAPFGNLYRAIDDRTVLAALDRARREGLTYWDTAPFYGHGLSEARIGEALGSLAPAEADSVLLSTKVGRLLDPVAPDAVPDCGFVDPLPFAPRFDYGAEAVRRSFEESCVRLGRDRIDIVFFHDLGRLTHGADHRQHFQAAMEEGLPVLRALQEAGRIGAIGLGANEWRVCAEAMDAGAVDCVLLAGRYTLFEHDDSRPFLDRCVREGVSVIVGGPFNSGLMAARPAADARYNYEPADAAVLERARRIWDVCARHGLAASAAALQFPLGHPAVVSVIPGAQSAAEVAGIAHGSRFAIPDPVWQELIAEGLVSAEASFPVGAGNGHAATAP